MSREIRAVALDWEHPLEPCGCYRRPLHPASQLQDDLADYQANPEDWEDGPPDPDDYMPQLPEGTPYGWQMYEDVTEGTPVSPVFKTKDELAEWLASPAAGREQISPESAARFIAEGWAPSFIWTPQTGQLVRGIEYDFGSDR